MIYYSSLAQSNIIPIVIKRIGALSVKEEKDLIKHIVDTTDARIYYNTFSIIKFITSISFATEYLDDLIDVMLNHDRVSQHYKIDLMRLINDRKHNEEYIKKFCSIENGLISEEASNILIEYYWNYSEIMNRFAGIDKFKIKFVEKKNVHSVSEIESEYLNKKYIMPLLNIPYEHEDNWLSLLEDSFKLYKSHADYYEYCRYIWSSVETFYLYHIENTPEVSLDKLISLSEKYQDSGGMLFSYILTNITSTSIRERARSMSFSSCVKYLNGLLRNNSDIVNMDMLLKVTNEVIQNDLRNWIENEGAYRLIKDLSGSQEDLIQKTIISQLELGFIKRGLDVTISRELQLIDNKRLDIVVSYGFIGRIVIELKRLDNRDIEPRNLNDYLDKLEQYRLGVKSDYLIFLILKINNARKRLNSKLNSIKEEIDLKGITGINVVGIDCILIDE